MSNKIIIYLLLIIIILSSILIIKINKTSKYDESTYSKVYEEYNEILSTNDNISTISNKTISTLNKETIYIQKNASDTNIFRTIAVIDIPKINLSYPVINDYSEENLNIAPTKYAGPEPHEVGNFVIVGHNNWNKEFFSNLNKLEKGDIVNLTDCYRQSVKYKVTDVYETEQDDFSCLNQDTNGKVELTLITCIKYKKNKRLIVKCEAI